MKLQLTLKHFLKEYQLPIYSGLLIGTSYIPFPPWATLFGFVPLWIYWMKQKSYKKIFISGWISQFLLTSIGFSWIAYNIHEFGGLPWIVSILGMLIFCSFANYYIPVAGLFWLLITKKLPSLPLTAKILLLAPIMALCEIFLQTIFKWNLSYTLMWVKLPIYQLAEFIGFEGLSSLMIVFNSIFLWVWIHRKTKKSLITFVITLFFLLLLNSLGTFVVKRWEVTDSIIRPLIVQANIPNQQKIYAEQGMGFRSTIVDKFFKLTSESLNQSLTPDFAIWPETAFPDYLNLQTGAQKRRLIQFIRENQLPLITGAYYRDNITNKSANSLFFIDGNGVVDPHPYNKTHLLAFGEYIPGSDTFPFLKNWLPMVADFLRGSGPMAIPFLDTKLGAQICYESLEPAFSRGLAIRGSELIVNVTNDSWFGWWQEPYQHLTMTLARGIEFRRPVIRSTNTGISTVMLASGEVLEKSPLDKEWAHIYTLPYKQTPPSTFYQNNFYLNRIVLVLFLVFLIGYPWRPKQSERD